MPFSKLHNCGLLCILNSYVNLMGKGKRVIRAVLGAFSICLLLSRTSK
uniref:Uncharacterized protein n=1 Tax=Rhizophora mucronata TaxID=61149 RepID=A0A2P2PFJ9_RHIMU